MLSTSDADNFIDNNKIIIWPETSFEGSIPSDMRLLSNISKKVLKNSNSILIVGLLRTEGKKLFNSLVFLNSKGQIIHMYDKIKLVPFGEYIPLRKLFRPISDFLPPSDFSSGKLNQIKYK